MRILFTTLLLLLLQAASAQPDSVRRFVDSALSLMQTRSLYADNLDWQKVGDSARKLAAGATSYADAGAAIKFAFNLLGDKHGWLVLAGEQYVNPFMRRDNSRINEATRSVITKPAVRQATLQGQYAYLSIPFFGGQTTKGMNDFAQRIQDSLGKALPQKPKGIIIDLRLNGGGNMYPMVVGVSNVLGNGRFTESVNGNGEVDGSFEMKDYTITLLDTMVVRLQKTHGNLENLPVAVLIGPATGSSGEQLAIILSLRKNTVLIGEPTAGYVTGNNGFLLPGNENGLVLAESYTKDSQGKVYKTDVEPALSITGGDNFTDLKQDKKIQAALEWLSKK
jgi:C-terminal processing protease CtpA/Prc